MKTVVNLCSSFWLSSLFAQTASEVSCSKATSDVTFLKIIESKIVINGKSSNVYEIILDDGSKILQRKQGECFNVIVDNQTSVPTALHWHGLILPNLQDGVPYVTQDPIASHSSYSYNFKIVQSGSYYAHSHYGLQEQKLLSIPMILQPIEESPYRDVVLFFEDFTFQSLDAVWQNLRKSYVEMAKAGGKGWKPNLSPKMMEIKPDLNDVKYDAYLTNRTTLENPSIFSVKAGEELRLRLINGSTSTGFQVNLAKLLGKVVAVDGNPVEPISLEEFPLATAQRVDVMVKIPMMGGAFPVLAQAQGTNLQTGVILNVEGNEAPSLSSTAKTSLGAITNTIETQLHALKPLSEKDVDRKLNVELEGNMMLYTWAINNFVWPHIQPLFVKKGERVEIAFINKTAMAHPMHLHGHVFQIVEIDGTRLSGAMRDTVLVMPNQTVKVQFDADNPGIWPMHCHISYHSWAGMFTVLQYDGVKPPYFSPSSIQTYSRIYGGY